MQQATILDQYRHLGLMESNHLPFGIFFQWSVSDTLSSAYQRQQVPSSRKISARMNEEIPSKSTKQWNNGSKMPMKNRRRILLQIVWMNLLQSDNWRISFRDKKMLRFDHKEFFLQFQNATGYIRVAIWVLIEPNWSLLLSRLSRAINIFLYVEIQNGAWRDSRIPIKQGDDW